MAKALSEELDEHLQCQIHLGTLKNPKSLQCHHTFCETCLDEWIAQKNGVLICPSCNRNHGPFPNGAKTLPNSYQIVGILDIMGREAEKPKPVCVRQNHKIVAFCSTCLESVCQTCLNQHHKSHRHQNLDTIKQELSNKKKTMQTALQRASDSHGHLKENGVIAKDKLTFFRAECIDMVNTLCDKAVDEVNAALDQKLSIVKKQMSDFTELYKQYREGENIIKTLSTKDSADQQENVQEMWDKLMITTSRSNTVGIENPYLKFEVKSHSDMNLNSAGKLILGTSPDPSLSQIEVARDAASADARVHITVNLQDSQKQEVNYGKEDIVIRVVQPDMSDGTIQNTGDSYLFVPAMIGDHKIHAYLYGRELCNSPYDLRILPTFNQKAEQFGDVKYKAAHDLVEFKNEIYITDKGNNRIVVTGKDGTMRREFTFKYKDMEHAFEPFGIVISQSGVVHITDMRNHEVFMSNTNGNLIKRFGKSKLKKPTGIALKENGDILVVDYDQHCICVFDQNGEFKRVYGRQGKGNGEFVRPWFIAIQRNQNWVVTDCDNFRFQIILRNGNAKSVPVTVYDKGAFVRGVTVDPNDNILVSVKAHTWGKFYQVLMYNSDGVFRGRISQEDVLLRPRGMCITKITTGKQVLLVADETGVLQFGLI